MFPAKNTTYERLEGGMGPGRQGKKLAWKKIAIGCGVLMGLVWFFGPRKDALSAGTPCSNQRMSAPLTPPRSSNSWTRGLLPATRQNTH